MKGAVILLFCLAIVAVSANASPTATEALEPALLLAADGTLVIEADGAVRERAVSTKVSAELREALLASIGKLRFRPVHVDGRPVRAKVAFYVLLSGEKLADGRMRANIDSIRFRTPKGETAVKVDGSGDELFAKRMNPPMYPREELRQNFMGEVLLAIRATPDGRTAEAMVVNSVLYNADASAPRARRALRAFETAALNAARAWTYRMPADAGSLSASQLTATTSVAYMYDFERLSGLQPGVWIPVLRTPKQSIAWLPREDARRLAETAVGPNAFAGAKSPYQLLDPVGGVPVL